MAFSGLEALRVILKQGNYFQKNYSDFIFCQEKLSRINSEEIMKGVIMNGLSNRLNGKLGVIPHFLFLQIVPFGTSQKH